MASSKYVCVNNSENVARVKGLLLEQNTSFASIFIGDVLKRINTDNTCVRVQCTPF